MAAKREERYIHFYTDGTAAYKMELAQPRKKTSLPKAPKKKVHVVYIDPVALVGLVLSMIMLVLMLSSVAQLNQEQAALQQMTDYLYTLESQNVVLQRQYEEQVDLEQVQQRALALGMIPIEDAEHITIQVQPHQEETTEELTLWQEICTYFEGLFA